MLDLRYKAEPSRMRKLKEGFEPGITLLVYSNKTTTDTRVPFKSSCLIACQVGISTTKTLLQTAP